MSHQEYIVGTLCYEDDVTLFSLSIRGLNAIDSRTILWQLYFYNMYSWDEQEYYKYNHK